MYRIGVGCFAEAYWEDGGPTRESCVLTVRFCLTKVHSILGHARLVQEFREPAGIIIHQDWRELTDNGIVAANVLPDRCLSDVARSRMRGGYRVNE
ncbi:hypothetical protein CWO89_44625 [Bradyrhizobium sp. Leo170]|nr:hypothetical protein CWO90_46880 [Bradyrhizobium sp. Leo121]TAI59736.1 hypothetical protein CWO89_44625 [Bradyrhizobium sp. Leo170]